MKVFFEIDGCTHCAVSSLVWYNREEETVHIVMPDGYEDILILRVPYDPFRYPIDVGFLDFRRFFAKYIDLGE